MTESCVKTRFSQAHLWWALFNICMLSWLITLIYLQGKMQDVVILYPIFCHSIWQRCCLIEGSSIIYWPVTFPRIPTDGAACLSYGRANFITMLGGRYKNSVRVDLRAVLRSSLLSWDCFVEVEGEKKVLVFLLKGYCIFETVEKENEICTKRTLLPHVRSLNFFAAP